MHRAPAAAATLQAPLPSWSLGHGADQPHAPAVESLATTVRSQPATAKQRACRCLDGTSDLAEHANQVIRVYAGYASDPAHQVDDQDDYEQCA